MTVAVDVAVAVYFGLWVVGQGPRRSGLTVTRRHPPLGPPATGRQQRVAKAPPAALAAVEFRL